MKKPSRKMRKLAILQRRARWSRSVIGASLLAAGLAVHAADADKSDAGKSDKSDKAEKLTPEQMYEGGAEPATDWVEFSGGDLITTGDKGQAQQNSSHNSGGFGGIEDLHLQKDVAKKTTLTIDGRLIPNDHDYKFGLKLEKEDVYFIRFSYENFRVYDAGNGGYSPVDGIAFPNPNDTLAVNRGQITLEASYFKEGKPKVTFKYTHDSRDGEEGSTIWGLPGTPTASTLRLNPSVETLSDKSDTFELDVSKPVKKTLLGVGLTYQSGVINNADLLQSFQSQQITDQQGVTYDMESVHAYSETWLKDNLFLSTGFMFANLDDTFSGSRIYGDDFDVLYSPAYPANYYGYYNLNGGAHQNEYILNVNFLSLPTKNNNFTISPSLRIQKEDWDANSTEMGTYYDGAGEQQPYDNNSAYNTVDVREQLEVRYTGVTNWVYSGTAQLTEGQGSLLENGGMYQPALGGPDGPAPIQFSTDDRRFFQKYALNARWYPLRTVNLDFGAYYKNNAYNYDNTYDSTPNNAGPGSELYPGFLVYQGFQTWDGNTRFTWHALQSLTLVTRYEYQLSTIETRPDPASDLSQEESSRMYSHILGENLSWVPLNWLSVQGGLNYVRSETTTPASGDPNSSVTQSILNSQNNYWTGNANLGFVLDDRTDLNLGYYYYRAADGQNTLVNGLPLGTDAEQNSISATLTRRINKHLRWNLKYAFTHYDDFASGGAYNFDAHLVYTSLQYRF